MVIQSDTDAKLALQCRISCLDAPLRSPLAPLASHVWQRGWSLCGFPAFTCGTLCTRDNRIYMLTSASLDPKKKLQARPTERRFDVFFISHFPVQVLPNPLAFEIVLRNEPERLEKLSIAALNVSVTAENASPVHIMHYAAALGAVDCLAVLILRLKGSPGVPRQLHCCDSRFPFGDRQGVLRLLIQSEFEVDFTALIESAAYFGDAVFAEHLLSEFGDFCLELDVALILACKHDHPFCARLLLKRRVDVNAKMPGGFTALSWASESGNAECVRLLLEHGADVSRDGFAKASAYGYHECLRLLLEHGADVNAKDIFGRTPLLSACDRGHPSMTECARLLLEHGADVNSRDRNNWTPLMHVSSRGNAECLELLLKHGADVKLGDRDGATALMLATANGHSRCARLLRARARRRFYLPVAALLVLLLGIFLYAPSSYPHLPATVLWSAPFFSGGGFGTEAIEFALALHSRNISFKIQQHGDLFSERYFRTVLESGTREVLVGHYVNWRAINLSESIVVCHSDPGGWRIGPHLPLFETSPCPFPGAAATVGRVMFETDRLPKGWAERLNLLTAVWVPSRWQLQTFTRAGVRPDLIRVVPEIVDTQLFDPRAVVPLSLSGADSSGFKFLSVFKWEKRKGWDLLLLAFFREFTSEEHVQLYILSNQYHSDVAFADAIAAFATARFPERDDLPRVHLVPPDLPARDMPRLYKSADAFVLPTRGEGWGRPLTEAMSMELPVIATQWSGQTEYLTEENSFPLGIEGTSVIPDGPFRGHRWADPSLPELQRLMRHVFEHQREAKARGVRARRDMKEFYGREKVGGILLGELDRVWRNRTI